MKPFKTQEPRINMFKKAIDKTPQSSDRTMQKKLLSMQAQNITKSETKFALA